MKTKLRPWFSARLLLTSAGCLCSLLTLSATAQEGQAAPSPPQSPRVVSVASDSSAEPNRAGLGDRITVTVEGLDTLIEAAGGDCSRIVLFLGGLPLKGMPPERCDPDDGHVGFYLVRTEGAESAWHALLGRPLGFTRQVMVTVGSSETRSVPTRVQAFQLEVVPRLGFYLFLLFLTITLVLVAQLVRRSELLRDPNASPAADQRRPFSLSRFQLAFWSLLVVTAYLFLWTVTGELDTITDSVLALLGIGSGTALGASLVDTGKRESSTRSRSRLAGEKAAVQSAISRLAEQIRTAGADAATQSTFQDELTARQSRLGEIEGLLAAEPAAAKGSSTGSFLRDVLSDAQGISIHRFQMLVWTVVLGVIFVASVYRSLQMPDFSPTLLALMGISNGTYLGFKFPERPAAGR